MLKVISKSALKLISFFTLNIGSGLKISQGHFFAVNDHLGNRNIQIFNRENRAPWLRRFNKKAVSGL